MKHALFQLEIRSSRKATGGSNPSPSAKFQNGLVFLPAQKFLSISQFALRVVHVTKNVCAGFEYYPGFSRPYLNPCDGMVERRLIHERFCKLIGYSSNAATRFLRFLRPQKKLRDAGKPTYRHPAFALNESHNSFKSSWINHAEEYVGLRRINCDVHVRHGGRSQIREPIIRVGQIHRVSLQRPTQMIGRPSE